MQKEHDGAVLTNILYLTYKTMNDYLDIPELAIVELLYQAVQRSNIVGYNGVVIPH